MKTSRLTIPVTPGGGDAELLAYPGNHGIPVNRLRPCPSFQLSQHSFNELPAPENSCIMSNTVILGQRRSAEASYKSAARQLPPFAPFFAFIHKSTGEPDCFRNVIAEMPDYVRPILPGSGGSAHNGAISAPWVSIEFIEACHDTGSQRIEMYMSGGDVLSCCTFPFTDQSISLSAAIPLSSIIREMPQDYNNYIQAFREKDGIHGHDV